jgi:serine/threonine protein phosphatase PrpC
MRLRESVRTVRAAGRETASSAAFVREAVMATRFARLNMAVASSRGTRHAVNEDAHSALDGTSPLFVVADGVSSGAMASRASGELVANLHAALLDGRIDAATVRRAILDADRGIAASIARRTDAPGAATVVLCVASGPALSRWLVAWVGDCRAYRVAELGTLPAELLTRDDTYRNLGEAPHAGGSPDDPARMIGNGAVDAPNVVRVDMRAGEMLVLMSDGVHRHADADGIASLLRGPGRLARRCVKLVEHVRSRGSHDDATVLVVQREAASARLTRALTIAALVPLFAFALVALSGDSEAASARAAVRQQAWMQGAT